MVDVHYFDRDEERQSNSLAGRTKTPPSPSERAGVRLEKHTDFFTICVEKKTQRVVKSAYREAAQHIGRPVNEVIEELTKQGYTHNKL